MQTSETIALPTIQNADARMNMDNATDASRLRFEAVQSTLEDLQAMHSDIVGVTLYGSVARAEAGYKSDIDGYMYVDIDKSTEISETDLQFEPGLIDFNEDIGPGITAAVHAELLGNLSEDFGTAKHSDNPFKDFKVVPISEQLIEEDVAKAAVVAEQVFAHQKYWAAYDSDPTKLDTNDAPEYPEDLVMLARQFKGLFHPDVTGSLAPYRATLLEKLRDLGPVGDIIWNQDIIDFVQTFEGNQDLGLPRTVDEACRAYNVPDAVREAA